MKHLIIRLSTVIVLCIFIDSMAFTDGVTSEIRQFSTVDALSALKMSVGDMAPSLDLDMDGNGQITSNDARLLLQKSVGKASADPIGQEGKKISDNQNAGGGIDNSPQPVAVTPPPLPATDPTLQGETSATPQALSNISGSTPPQPLSGSWSGYWMNNLGENGTESLILEESGNGEINGTWSGNILVTGRRINATTIALQGQTQRRAYKVQGTIQGNELIFRYTAERLDRNGSYEGKSIFRRVQ